MSATEGATRTAACMDAFETRMHSKYRPADLLFHAMGSLRMTHTVRLVRRSSCAGLHITYPRDHKAALLERGHGKLEPSSPPPRQQGSPSEEQQPLRSAGTEGHHVDFDFVDYEINPIELQRLFPDDQGAHASHRRD